MHPVFRFLTLAYAWLIGLAIASTVFFASMLKPGEIGGFALFPLLVPALPWVMLMSPSGGDGNGLLAWLAPLGLLLCYALNFACLYGAGMACQWVEDGEAAREDGEGRPE